MNDVLLNEIKTLSVQIHPDLVAIRRHLHQHPELSFVEIGVSEVKLALAKGWIKSGDYLDVAVQFDGIANSARPTERTWLRSLRAYRFKAPVEVVKLVRLQTSGAL